MYRHFINARTISAKMKASAAFALCAVLLATLAGCNTTGGGMISTPPAITSVNPSSGAVGTTVTITGTAFGASQSAGTGVVAFSGTVAPVISWSATSIVAEVPTGAATGNVVVTVLGTASNGVNFTVSTGVAATCGTGSESLLSGSYAYSLSGFAGANPVARVGSFTANGHGGITTGTEDLNASTNGDLTHNVSSTGSSYSVGPDNRGCMTLSYSDGSMASYRFSLSAITSSLATRGHIVQFDSTGDRGSGVIVQQTTSAFTSSALLTRYAIGLGGFDTTGGHVAEAGTFTLAPGSGGTNITAGYFDYNDAGSLLFGLNGTAGGSTGSMVTSAISSTTGRTTATFAAGIAGVTAYTFHWAVYVVNANQFFLISTDTLGTTTPLVSGRAIATGTGSFSSSSLLNQPGYILEATGVSGGAAISELEQVVFTAPAAFAAKSWTYGLGTGVTITPPASPVSLGTSFDVSAQGRITFGNDNSVIYLTTPTAADNIAGFVAGAGTDTSAYSGLLVVQTATTVTPELYFFGNASQADASVVAESGVTVITGSSSASNMSGILDENQGSGLSSLTFANVGFSFSALGLGTATDSAGDTYVGIADGTALFLIEENTVAQRSASVIIVQQ